MYSYEKKIHVPKGIIYICILLIVSITGNIVQYHSIEELRKMDIEDTNNYQLLNDDYQKLLVDKDVLQQEYNALLEKYNKLYKSCK